MLLSSTMERGSNGRHNRQPAVQWYRNLVLYFIVWGAMMMTADAQKIGPPLSMDVTSAVQQSANSIFLGRVVRTQASKVTFEDRLYNVGTMEVAVLENLQRTEPHAGTTVTVPFHHVADGSFFKQNWDHWNEMNLGAGQMLLLVCVSKDGGKTWQASAGVNVASAEDPQVQAVRKAEKIEHSSISESVPAKQKELEQALASENDALFIYAATSLAQRRILGSFQSAQVLATAMTSSALPESNRAELPNQAFEWFGPETEKDLEGAKELTAAFAQRFVTATDPKDKANLAFKLSSCMDTYKGSAEGEARQLQIISRVSKPTPTLVEHELRMLASDQKVLPDADDRRTINHLEQLWRRASASKPQVE